MLWDQKLPNARSVPLIGNGLVYVIEVSPDAQGANAVRLVATDAGAPLADSAWPAAAGWPDGSRRARPRSYPPPFVTMLHSSPRSGAVLEFGAEDGLGYSVQMAPRVGGAWIDIGSVTGSGFGAQFIDRAGGSDSMRFYRVVRMTS